MGRGGTRTLRVAPRFDHHDGFGAGRSPGGRHELARIVDRLDIEQDGARRTVDREIVETIGEIDVDLVAERHDRRKADFACCRPFDHAGRDRARLRNEREIAGMWRAGREARVQPGARHHHAEAVRTDQPEPVCARRLCGLVRE